MITMTMRFWRRPSDGEQKCRVINISLGGHEFHDKLLESVLQALKGGVILVCSASNEGRTSRKNIASPAAFGGGVFCVGAHDEHGKPLPLSPCGQQLDLLAPGSEIISCFRNGYTIASGPSQAAAVTSGLVARILSDGNNENVIKNGIDMKNVLHSMCTMAGHHDASMGHGALCPEVIFDEKFSPPFVKEKLGHSIY